MHETSEARKKEKSLDIMMMLQKKRLWKKYAGRKQLSKGSCYAKTKKQTTCNEGKEITSRFKKR